MLCLLASFSAHAAQPQAGQWRVTTKTTIAGLPAGVPAGMGQPTLRVTELTIGGTAG